MSNNKCRGVNWVWQGMAAAMAPGENENVRLKQLINLLLCVNLY